MKIGVRKLQKLAESLFIRRRQGQVVLVEEPHQQRIEFARAAAAAPSKSGPGASLVVYRPW